MFFLAAVEWTFITIKLSALALMSNYFSRILHVLQCRSSLETWMEKLLSDIDILRSVAVASNNGGNYLVLITG